MCVRPCLPPAQPEGHKAHSRWVGVESENGWFGASPSHLSWAGPRDAGLLGEHSGTHCVPAGNQLDPVAHRLLLTCRPGWLLAKEMWSKGCRAQGGKAGEGWVMNVPAPVVSPALPAQLASPAAPQHSGRGTGEQRPLGQAATGAQAGTGRRQEGTGCRKGPRSQALTCLIRSHACEGICPRMPVTSPHMPSRLPSPHMPVAETHMPVADSHASPWRPPPLPSGLLPGGR